MPEHAVGQLNSSVPFAVMATISLMSTLVLGGLAVYSWKKRCGGTRFTVFCALAAGALGACFRFAAVYPRFTVEALLTGVISSLVLTGAAMRSHGVERDRKKGAGDRAGRRTRAALVVTVLWITVFAVAEWRFCREFTVSSLVSHAWISALGATLMLVPVCINRDFPGSSHHQRRTRPQ